MPVPVVGVGDVRMVVRQRVVAVPVAVRLRRGAVVWVVVMLVVNVGVLVLEGLVGVDVGVAGAREQDDAGEHRGGGEGVGQGGAFAEERNRERCAEERG